MKMNFKTHQKFRILFYNSKLSVNKVKENLNPYGFVDLFFATDESDLINTVRGLDPHVIVVSHHDCNNSNVPTLLKQLRVSKDTPVIVWCENMSEYASRILLSFKNTYTLNVSDGFISLTEILQRIEMKTKNPKLWV